MKFIIIMSLLLMVSCSNNKEFPHSDFSNHNNSDAIILYNNRLTISKMANDFLWNDKRKNNYKHVFSILEKISPNDWKKVLIRDSILKDMFGDFVFITKNLILIYDKFYSFILFKDGALYTPKDIIWDSDDIMSKQSKLLYQKLLEKEIL